MLLRRRRVPVLDAVERLVGMQAQVPRDPYIALWSRLDRFRAEALAAPIAERLAVRMGLLRSTLHLVTALDALGLRPVLEPVVQRVLHNQSPFGRRLEGPNVDELVAVATEVLEERPRTRAELAPLLGERWPDHDAASLAYAVTYLLPLVQVTPRGIWGQTGPSAFTTVERWLGRPLEAASEPDEMVLRYLAAFGPSTVADVQSWSGLTGLRAVIERLRPRLRTFRDERARELFDVPGAPLPGYPGPAALLARVRQREPRARRPEQDRRPRDARVDRGRLGLRARGRLRLGEMEGPARQEHGHPADRALPEAPPNR